MGKHCPSHCNRYLCLSAWYTNVHTASCKFLCARLVWKCFYSRKFTTLFGGSQSHQQCVKPASPVKTGLSWICMNFSKQFKLEPRMDFRVTIQNGWYGTSFANHNVQIVLNTNLKRTWIYLWRWYIHRFASGWLLPWTNTAWACWYPSPRLGCSAWLTAN